MQPYQEAGQEAKRQSEMPYKTARTAGAILGSAAGIGLPVSRVLPFLSKYIPADLAIKGLSKIDPRFGKFIEKGLKEGYDFNEIKDFIEKKAKQGSEKEPAKEGRNIIEQYSPELHQFIDQHVKVGKNPIQAGSIAQGMSQFQNIIRKLVKDHKAPWSNILESVYGGQGMAQQQQGQQQQQMQQPQQQMQQPQQGQQQPGQGQQGMSDADLLSAIERTLKL